MREIEIKSDAVVNKTLIEKDKAISTVKAENEPEIVNADGSTTTPDSECSCKF